MSIEQLGNAPTLADLRMQGVPEFVSEGTKRMYRASNGKLVEERVGVEYIQTVGAGRLRAETWKQYVDAAIQREDRTKLLDAIISYLPNHCYWLRTDEERRDYALDILVSGSYQNWKDFKNPEQVNLADFF